MLLKLVWGVHKLIVSRFILIENTRYLNNKALNKSNLFSFDDMGKGGAIYFSCENEKICNFTIRNSTFVFNSATSGGAIYFKIILLNMGQI